MRILHLVHQYPPDYVGGTEIYTQVLARHQIERRHEVGVFYRRGAARPGLERRMEEGVHVWAASDGPVSPQRRLAATFGSPALRRGWRQALDEFAPQVVHVQHLMGLPASLLRALAQRRIPYVLTLHDYWWICANAQLLTNYDQTICDGPQAFANCARCALARWGRPAFWPAFPGMAALLGARNLLLGRALSAARYCIAPTRFVADWYARHGVPVQRLVVIPHGIDMPQGLPIGAGARHTPLRVAYIGGLTWQKGVHIVLEALKRCRGDVELWIAGDESADPGYIHRLKAAAPANARFLGKLSRPQVWATLAQLDALVVPSLWYETFSLVAHEAHAAGVPVIASDLGALAEVVRQGIDGLLVTAGDVSSWHMALQRLVDDPGLLPQLRGDPLRPLSLREHVDQIESVYTRVITDGA